MAVASPRYAVFIPAIGPGAGLIIRQVVPGIAVGAVVLSHRSPGAFADVRAPTLPVSDAVATLLQSNFFSRHGCSPLHPISMQSDPAPNRVSGMPRLRGVQDRSPERRFGRNDFRVKMNATGKADV